MTSLVFYVISSDNGFVSDCTEPLHEAMLTYRELGTHEHISTYFIQNWKIPIQRNIWRG